MENEGCDADRLSQFLTFDFIGFLSKSGGHSPRLPPLTRLFDSLWRVIRLLDNVDPSHMGPDLLRSSEIHVLPPGHLPSPQVTPASRHAVDDAEDYCQRSQDIE